MTEERQLVFQVPAEVTKVQSMSNRSVRIQVDTEEDLTDKSIAELFSFFEKRGWFTFLVERQIDAADIIDTPEWKPEFPEEKSPASRMRNVIYKIFEGRGKPGDFDTYYKKKMEKLIEALKERI